MNRSGAVLDASALLCLLFSEVGADKVEARMADAKVSAVNFSEVVAKLIDRGVPGETVISDLAELDIGVVDFDRRQAERAGLMRDQTRALGLSFADRACLALAEESGASAVTADGAWAALDVGVAIEVVR